jgi:hypothetical protein
MRGYRTYRLAGVRLHATPWAVPYVEQDVLRLMVAEMTAAGIASATLSADRAHGPFRAKCGDTTGVGATPLAAVRNLVDRYQRPMPAGWG